MWLWFLPGKDGVSPNCIQRKLQTGKKIRTRAFSRFGPAILRNPLPPRIPQRPTIPRLQGHEPLSIARRSLRLPAALVAPALPGNGF